MHVELRYVTQRLNRNGTLRHYWQRPGHKLTRLPADPIKRFQMATRLNDAADRKETDVLIEGSIGWVIHKYKLKEDYTELAVGTLKYYNRYLKDIEALGRSEPFESITRRDVIDFVESYTGIGEDRKIVALLRKLYKVAMYYEVVTANHSLNLDLSTPEARQVFWLPEQGDAWMKAAALHPKGDAMAVGYKILEYAAQRPNDVLKMAWTQYNGDTIQLRQQKTKKLVSVPCHRALRAVLDEARKRTMSTMIVSHQGKAFSYGEFNRCWREISEVADLEDLQARDLRRTACVRMAEAGATESQISAVTGHTIESTRQILETYIPRTEEMARGAIEKLEARSENK